MTTLTNADDTDEVTEALADETQDMEKYAPLVPIFGAVEAIFDAWESVVRQLELETEPPVWTKKLNRVERRAVIFRRGDEQPQRSRIRRRINRIERQKGNYQ